MYPDCSQPVLHGRPYGPLEPGNTVVIHEVAEQGHGRLADKDAVVREDQAADVPLTADVILDLSVGLGHFDEAAGGGCAEVDFVLHVCISLITCPIILRLEE